MVISVWWMAVPGGTPHVHGRVEASAVQPRTAVSALASIPRRSFHPLFAAHRPWWNRAMMSGACEPLRGAFAVRALNGTAFHASG